MDLSHIRKRRLLAYLDPEEESNEEAGPSAKKRCYPNSILPHGAPSPPPPPPPPPAPPAPPEHLAAMPSTSTSVNVKSFLKQKSIRKFVAKSVTDQRRKSEEERRLILKPSPTSVNISGDPQCSNSVLTKPTLDSTFKEISHESIKGCFLQIDAGGIYRIDKTNFPDERRLLINKLVAESIAIERKLLQSIEGLTFLSHKPMVKDCIQNEVRNEPRFTASADLFDNIFQRITDDRKSDEKNTDKNQEVNNDMFILEDFEDEMYPWTDMNNIGTVFIGPNCTKVTLDRLLRMNFRPNCHMDARILWVIDLIFDTETTATHFLTNVKIHNQLDPLKVYDLVKFLKLHINAPKRQIYKLIRYRCRRARVKKERKKLREKLKLKLKNASLPEE